MPESLKERVLEQLGRIEVDESAALAIRGWGPEALDLLRRVVRGAVKAGDYERANAAWLLGLVAGPNDRDRVVEELARPLHKDEVARVRLSAIHAIGRLGGPEARKLLLGVLASEKTDVTERLHAAELLADIGETEDLEALKALEPEPEELTLQRRVDLAIEKIVLRHGRPPAGKEDGGGEDRPAQSPPD